MFLRLMARKNDEREIQKLVGSKAAKDKKMNQKIFLFLTLFFLNGCASVVPKFPSLTTPEKPRTVYNWNEEVVTEPKVVKTGEGEFIVQRTEKRLSAGLDTTPRRVGFMESIGGFIAGLSFWIFALIFLGFILAPGATIGFLFKKYLQYKNAMKQTVAAIKEAKAVDSQVLHDALKARQTTDTKKIVGNLKADL